MRTIWGFDLGTSSVGWAIVKVDEAQETGSILGMGSRIFSEPTDDKGNPFNADRRAKRLARRQLRRRKRRRRDLNKFLQEVNLLPPFGTSQWDQVMGLDPYLLRYKSIPLEALPEEDRPMQKAEKLEPPELGRILYHLGKHRGFSGRDELAEEGAKEEGQEKPKQKKKKKADTEATGEPENPKAATEDDIKKEIEALENQLSKRKLTLGQYLYLLPAKERKRNRHTSRAMYESEFEKLIHAQSEFHPFLRDEAKVQELQQILFFQRPVFWRKSTLGTCRFMPGEDMAMQGSWQSEEFKLWEQLSKLRFTTGNKRELIWEEKKHLHDRLWEQKTMSWSAVIKELNAFYAGKGDKESALPKYTRFNLEEGGEKQLKGNAVEVELAGIFGASWKDHPHKEAIRLTAIPSLLRALTREKVQPRAKHKESAKPNIRIELLSAKEKIDARQQMRAQFAKDWQLAPDQAEKLAQMKIPGGWMRYSQKALDIFLSEMMRGKAIGSLIGGREEEFKEWRRANFPDMQDFTGEILNKLPSRASEMKEVLGDIRNPMANRSINELRKVVNNLLRYYRDHKPDLIRIEMSRKLRLPKKDRDKYLSNAKKREKERNDAIADLERNNIAATDLQIKKYLLWQECQEQCFYTGKHIGFEDLFGPHPKFEIEHIFPISWSQDNSLANLTLCEREFNRKKHGKMPWDCYDHSTPDWDAFVDRVKKRFSWVDKKSKEERMWRKGRHLLADPDSEWFKKYQASIGSRHEKSTEYVARLAVRFLQRLFPDTEEGKEKVKVTQGGVTAHLRREWSLNSLLSDDPDVKNRKDHRHHALDALVIALSTQALIKRVNEFHKREEEGERPKAPLPWDSFCKDAKEQLEKIIVSHRVQRKVSGALHKEMPYGDTGQTVKKGAIVSTLFVKRGELTGLTPGQIENIRDPEIRQLALDRYNGFNGDKKKAFLEPLHMKSGIEVKRARFLSPFQRQLMVQLDERTGAWASPDSNHHIAIYELNSGEIEYDVVSLFEAARRLRAREDIVRRNHVSGGRLLMSLAKGDMLQAPNGDYIIVKILASDGRAYCLPHLAAGKEYKKQSLSINPLIEQGYKKVKVNPIGLVFSAND